jgi:uncharacterized glyoxalase superfamily protein PhnB
METLFQITVVVNNYDEAIAWYQKNLQFQLVEDTVLTPQKRWVVMQPSGGGCQILLAKAATPLQQNFVGNQTGGRVAFFLHTNRLQNLLVQLQNNGVTIVRPPTVEPYGTVFVLADLYGNLWDIIEATAANPS